MTETAHTLPPARSAASGRLRLFAGLLAVVLIVAVGAAYAARRALAREALTGWLQARGVSSSVEFRDFGLGAFSARLRIGDPRDPDVSAELARVRYGLTGFWAGQPLGVQVTSVELHRPIIKAAFRNGKLSLGSLDPVIEAFAKRPSRPDAPQPRITISKGVLNLTSDYGRVQADLDAQVADGRLMRLDARLAPAALKGQGVSLLSGEGRVQMATTRNRVDALLDLPIKRLDAQGSAISDGKLRLSLAMPYPDVDRRRSEGLVRARLDLAGRRIELAGARLEAPKVTGVFDGRTIGGLNELVVQGGAEIDLASDVASRGADTARGVDLALHAHDLRWSRVGGESAATLFAELRADAARSGDITLASTLVRFQGPARMAGQVREARLTGLVETRGAWSGLGAVTKSDPQASAALKRALAGFRVEAPQIELAVSGTSVAVGLPAPARMVTDTGGQAVLSAAGGPVYADGRGALRLAVSGGGLPQVDLAAPRYQLTADGLTATTELKASGAFGPVVDATLDAAGQLVVSGGVTRFAASRCAIFQAGRIELGENAIEDAGGRLCAAGGPMLELAAGRWRLQGQAQGVAADAPFLQARTDGVQARLDLTGAGEDLSGLVTLIDARVADTSPQTRFAPLQVSGDARARGGIWTAGLDIADAARRGIGRAEVRQGADGRGELTLDTGLLAFAPEGMQPAQLSPLAAAVGSPVTGQARFAGRIGWSPGGLTSDGRLTLQALDFVSPAGAVKGLSGEIVFESLVPLVAAPGQQLRAAEVDTLVPLANAVIDFSIAQAALEVSGAVSELGGGKVALENLRIPFAPGADWGGVLAIDGVQVADLIEASPFGDRMDMVARLSGRVPFQVTPQGIRIAGGTLRAIEPGRLSIRREALTVVGAEGGQVVGAPSTPATPAEVDPYSDFVYQALEHLSFTELSADVDSQADGRLGVRFHILGEHSPPKSGKIRLTLREIITQKITRALPLPKGTKVNLTLDTSVNLDQLLEDFANYQALRGSGGVQP